VSCRAGAGAGQRQDCVVGAVSPYIGAV